MEIKITTPTPEDAQGIIECIHETWLASYPNEEFGITRDDVELNFLDMSHKIESHKKRLAKKDDREIRLVAKDGDKVVGMANLTLENDRNYLHMIYILPVYQRMGIGQKIWEIFKTYLNPEKKTVLIVAVYNAPAISFYKKLGFVDTGKRMDSYKFPNGKSFPELEMELRV